MLVKYEDISANEVKFYIESTPEQVKEKVNEAYNKTKGKYDIKGFRKGKAPKTIIEQTYGEKVFYDEAFDNFVNEEISKVIEEKKLNIYGEPRFADIVIEDEKMAFSVEFTILPMPEFSEYKGIEVPDLQAEVSEEDIQGEIDQEVKKNSRLVAIEGRPAKDGDTLEVDFVGSIDGVEFEGGSAEGVSLTIGEGRFIPGFEEQLVDANVGDDVTVNVTFPEDYGQEDLAGKDAVFEVKVNEIKEWEAPDFDDEFVSDISEFESVDDYKKSIEEKLLEAKKLEIRKNQEDIAIKTLVKNSVLNLPKALYENNFQRELDGFTRNMQMYGMNLEDYAKMIGQTEEDFKEEMRKNTNKHLEEVYALIKLAEKEELIPSPEQMDELVALRASRYNMSVEAFNEEMAKNPGMLDSIFEEGMQEAATKAIMDNVVYVDPKNFEGEKEE